MVRLGVPQANKVFKYVASDLISLLLLLSVLVPAVWTTGIMTKVLVSMTKL